MTGKPQGVWPGMEDQETVNPFTIDRSGFHTEGGRPGIPPSEKIDGNIISIMNVDVHYRK